MCPRIALNEVVPPWDSVFSAITVSDVDQGYYTYPSLIEVSNSDQNVQDRLCGYIWYGRTAYMLDPHYVLSEGCSDFGSLSFIRSSPSIVRLFQRYVTGCEAEDHGYLSVPPNVRAASTYYAADLI
jgi:hypothetical protein